MASEPITSRRMITAGDIIREISFLIQDNGRLIGIYALILAVLYGASGAFGDSSSGMAIAISFIGAISGFVVYLVAIYQINASMLRSRGLPVSGGISVLFYFIMAMISSLAIGLGLLLIIVPGVFLLVRWSAAPAYIFSGEGDIISSLSQSWHATEGNGLSIFLAGLGVVVFVIFFAMVFVGVPALLLSSAGSMIASAIEGIFQAIYLAISAAFSIAVFYLLNGSSEEIEEVFA